jgi:hypothetical protein
MLDLLGEKIRNLTKVFRLSPRQGVPVNYFLKSIMEEPFCVRVTPAIFESRQVALFSIIDVTSHTVNREPVKSCINIMI